ncbi:MULTISPECIES: hypothetical protein [Enterococcus]|uniref:hypothetical protein n=1 Tax=Enterococcus TaxID=1350 RepID=UPI000A37A4CE|nr:hypothetical protein [Enterococcus sp. 4E1_DIV0656]OTO09123.1 hypothetical protein A5882_003453 [Enterococcus sp. 4E1_DIV0656]
MANISSITSKAISGIKNNPMKVLGSVGVAATVIPDYKQSRANGSSLAGSAAKAAASTLFSYTNPLLYGAFETAPLIYAGAKGAYEFRQRRGEQMRMDLESQSRGFVGGGYVDTQQAQTMRQAAVQQIQGNKLNARSALGGEARLLSPYGSR